MKIRSLSQLALTAPFTQGSQCATNNGDGLCCDITVTDCGGFAGTLVTEQPQ